MPRSTRLALAVLRTAPTVSAGADTTSVPPGPVAAYSSTATGSTRRQAVLLFTDDLQPDSVSVTLTAASGARVSLAPPEVIGKTVLQHLADLPAGAATLSYRVRCENGQWAEGAITVEATGEVSPAAPVTTTASTGTVPAARTGWGAVALRPAPIAVTVGGIVAGAVAAIMVVARHRA